MSMEPDHLPEDIECAVLELLDGPGAAISAGVERLCALHPQWAAAIRRAAAEMSASVTADKVTRPARATLGAVITPDLPREIGPFHILSEVGSGGMGTVYLAEQRSPVTRRVALKVVKLGMDTRAVLARFEVERQALAMMDHACIAKVFEAGATAQGRPYFAMEYVRGVPITRYCDSNRLSIEERLELFAQVCGGVQHAHHKGVVHRDLTPNNILVTVQDGKPMAKIIDFGLARATDHRLTAKTVFTERGIVMGTPEYMSPEQAGLDGLDIDTRSDVYTLGVLLYELLTGTLPFSSVQLRKGGYDEMCRIIRAAEPEKPSTRVPHEIDTGTAARLRRTEPNRLLRQLRGDLDWIVLKCLEKDRTRRYQSPAALADDIRRYLSDQPVEARPPSGAYILKKMARRYRGPLAAAGAVFVALVAGLVVATFFWQKWQRVADANAENERLANERATQLAGKIADYNRLARVVQVARHEELTSQQDEIWPAQPARLEATKEWLARAEALLAQRADLGRVVQELEANAQPQPNARAVPAAARLRGDQVELKRRQVESLERAQRARTTGEPVPIPVLDPDVANHRPDQLNAAAWDGVAPWRAERKVWGDEPKCVALAALALAMVEADEPQQPARDDVLETLMWARFAVGDDAGARLAADQAVAAAPEDRRLLRARAREDLGNAIAGSARALDTARAEWNELVQERREHPRLVFGDEVEGALHSFLSRLLDGLAAFEAGPARSVRKRREWIETDERHRQQYAAAWSSARAAIRNPDGRNASRLYAECPIDLQPQLGLVPIGPNPKTGLWEFYHPRTAADPDVLPRHDAEGTIDIGPGTGLVFVLVPGGTFLMGAQNEDRGSANHDPLAENAEMPVHRVVLDPFFLSRYELTQAQWERLTLGRNPSHYAEGEGPNKVRLITAMNPVESVSHQDCLLWLGRHDLVLPTEAQWEYACRAGTPSPWASGGAPEGLLEYGNVADVTAKSQAWGCEDWDDGHIVHAPVGRFAPNAFGLHDVHGNVWEWTRDELLGYQADVRPGDGLRGERSDIVRAHAFRGGCFSDPARKVRTTNRDGYMPNLRSPIVGVRPARALVR